MTLRDWIYFSLLLINALLGVIRWRHLSRADRCLAVLLWTTLADESLAFSMSLKNLNNTWVYGIYNPIELLLLSLYFNYSVAALKRRHAGWITGLAGLAFTLSAALFRSPTAAGNADFLLLEGTVIIIFCLFSIRQTLLEAGSLPYRFARFWLTCALLLYWSLTFTGWGIFSLIASKKQQLFVVFYQILLWSNYCLYACIALILYYYKKLIPSGA